jgi:putative hydrolase of the HAD superfamily
MNRIKAIVFDLDDTLFPEHQFVLSGIHAVSDWISNQLSVTGFFEIAWKLFKDGKRLTIFDQALDILGVPYTPDLIQQLVQVYRNHKPTISLHPDAAWALHYFKQGRSLGIITNGFPYTQQNKIDALGVESQFAAIICCGAYGVEYFKPNPFAYQKMMELTGHQPNEYIYVGDHPYKDFPGAKALGWKTVRICRPDGEYTNVKASASDDAELKITSLYELESIIS